MKSTCKDKDVGEPGTSPCRRDVYGVYGPERPRGSAALKSGSKRLNSLLDLNSDLWPEQASYSLSTFIGNRSEIFVFGTLCDVVAVKVDNNQHRLTPPSRAPPAPFFAQFFMFFAFLCALLLGTNLLSDVH